MKSPAHLVDRIYEAAILPELWPSVLDDVSRIAGGCGGLLFTATVNQITRWTSSEALKEDMSRFVNDPDIAADNIRLRSGVALRRHGFFTNDELYAREDMERSFVYSKFFHPKGLGWCAGTVIPTPSGDHAIFDIERRYVDGPVPRSALAVLDELRPHLARAAVLAARLCLERARAVVEALAAAGLPGAVMAVGGRLLAINSAFEDLSPQVAFIARDRMRLADGGAQSIFEDALAAQAGLRASRSIAIPALHDNPPAALHLLPLAGGARDVFSQATTLAIVTKLDRLNAPTAELLTGLFDLTASEARVARGVSEGRSLDEIASVHHLSKETVRYYLKSVFAKTGANGQADLRALLAGAVMPGVRG